MFVVDRCAGVFVSLNPNEISNVDAPNYAPFFFFFACVFLVLGLLLLGLEPVGKGGGGAGGLLGDVLALNLDGHALVLLEVAGEVGLLGGLGGLGDGKGLDLADRVRLLDGGDLVGLELLQVQLLDKVG